MTGNILSIPEVAPAAAGRPGTANGVTTTSTTRFDVWRGLLSKSFVPLHAQADHPERFYGLMRSRAGTGSRSSM